MTRSPRRRLAALVAALALVAGCSQATGETPADIEPEAGASSSAPGALARPPAGTDSGAEIARYVALGDSFTAAPFVPITDLADGCFRSSGNYPALVAEGLDITEVTDVSCSGADTASVTGRQQVAGGRGTVPPQLRAVAADTDLVTIGLGGNDENLFALLVRSCAGLGPGGAVGAPAEDCALSLPADPAAVVRATGRRVGAVVRAVQAKAPEATVVVVGYPRLVDPRRSCADLPLDARERRVVAGLESQLNDALARAARARGAAYVDLHPLSEGHEICSDDPWVNGATTDQERALAFHPFAVEQEAVAAQVLALASR